MPRIGRKTVAAAVVLTLASPAVAEDTVKMGALATLEGAFTVLGEDGMRGVELALEEFGYTAGGKKVELITGSSDASPDSAIRATRKLVEQDGVQILIGPLSGSEGLAVKDYAKTQPSVTFLNGTSAAQDTTLRQPAENFFRFNTDGAQWMAGLGAYVYNEKGYRKVAVLAKLAFDTPTGKVSLDERRQAVADMFLTEVTEGPDGNLLNKTIKVIPQVNQTLGVPYEKFLEYGQGRRENPTCE